MTALPQPASGQFDGLVHRYAVRVYYEDTDLSGVVYHANYLRWFERARSDMLRLVGIDQRAAFDAGEGAWAVADLTLRYHAPARLEDTVIIASRVEAVAAASCHMHQQAWRGDQLLADGRLRIGFVAPSGRPKRQPAEWRRAFASLLPDSLQES